MAIEPATAMACDCDQRWCDRRADEFAVASGAVALNGFEIASRTLFAAQWLSADAAQALAARVASAFGEAIDTPRKSRGVRCRQNPT